MATETWTAEGINLITGTYYGEDGFDRNGYNENGYDASGYDTEGYDEYGMEWDPYGAYGNYLLDCDEDS